MKRWLILCLCVLMIPVTAMAIPMPGTPLSGTITITGTHDTIPQYDVTDTATIILRDAHLKNLRLVNPNFGSDEPAGTVTIVLYGDNTIVNDFAYALDLYCLNGVIVSGEEDATLLLQGGSQEYIDRDGRAFISGISAIAGGNSYFEKSLTINANNVTIKAGDAVTETDWPVTQDCMPALFMGNCTLTLAGDNIRIIGGSTNTLGGQEWCGPASALGEETVIISGSNVYISGGTAKNGRRAPAFGDGVRQVILTGTEDEPIFAEAGDDVLNALEGSPFAAETDVREQAGRLQHFRTRIDREEPAPVVPDTGDGADLALWVGLAMLSAAVVIGLKRKHA